MKMRFALWVLTAVLLSPTLGPHSFAAEGENADTKAALAAEAIARRIAKRRTAEVTLTVLDADGKPAAGRRVTVRMVRHKFLFGCNAYRLRPAEVSAASRAYGQRFAELLNYATLPFYWGSFERGQGRTEARKIRDMALWCKKNGIRTKGHPLCWHQVFPKWAMGKDPNEVLRLQLARITRDVKGFAGLIYTWDVVNEAVVMPKYKREPSEIPALCRKLGQAGLIQRTFEAARAANPKATLLLNDYDTSPKYEQLIEQCLAAGVRIDVIGIQSHMHRGYRGSEWAWKVCERFARFDRPLHWTEATIQSGRIREDMRWSGQRFTDWPTTPEGEARQAREVAEFYTVLFSHPAVEAITWWDFSDDRAWMGAPSGLVRKDMTPKPAYKALMKLIKGQWWTKPQTLTTDKAGRVKFTGFLGDYEATCDGAKAKFAVDSSGKAATVITLR